MYVCLRPHRLALRRWIACLIALVAACTPARKEIETDIVRRVRFEGNGGTLSGHNDLQLRQQMELTASRRGLLTFPFLYAVDPKPLRRELLPRDAYRLEVWYAHHGFFDAKVVGWEVREVRRASEKQGTGKWGFADRQAVFDVRGVIEPGPPSEVRAFAIDGLAGALEPVAGKARRTGLVREGEQFNLEYVELDKQQLLRDLRNLARAYAAVEVSLFAVPRRRAVDVTFVAEPGIVTVYGPVGISGLRKVPEAYIRSRVTLEEGSAYQLDELQEVQEDLFATQLFTLVQVVPDLSDPTRREVPVEVRFTEARFRTLRIGVGFEAENLSLFQPRMQVRYRDVNVAYSLLRLDSDASLGVALISGTDGQSLRPTYGVGAALLYPRLGRKLDLELRGRVEQDLLPGLWMYRQPTADLQAVITPDRSLTIRVGPHVEEYRYLDLEEGGSEPATRLFGASGDFRNPYQITSLDVLFALDWRIPRPPEETVRGSYSTLGLRRAVPITPDGYDYVSGSAEWRFFRPLKFRRTAADFPLVLATRIRGRALISLAEGGVVPYPELAFLGGSSSLRGFRHNQVGNYDTICTYSEVTDIAGNTSTAVQHFHLPQGGTFAPDASIELRYPWLYGVTIATFLDAGMLETDVRDLVLDARTNLRWSAGVGARYGTPVGPFRFDLSFRRLYPEDLHPDSYVGCRTDDQVARTPDFFGQFGDFRPRIAMVFFIALGNPF